MSTGWKVDFRFRVERFDLSQFIHGISSNRFQKSRESPPSHCYLDFFFTQPLMSGGAVITHVAATLPTPFYMLYNQKAPPTSETFTNNTTCDREERTFQVDSSIYGENKYMGRSCMAAIVKISKGMEQRQLFSHQSTHKPQKCDRRSNLMPIFLIPYSHYYPKEGFFPSCL